MMFPEVIPMIKRSKVEKITGFTTKTLRGYADIGLVKPTKDEDGHLVYDQPSYERLMLIHDLAEVGLPRNLIQRLIQEQLQPAEMMERAVDYLRKKKRETERNIQEARQKQEFYRYYWLSAKVFVQLLLVGLVPVDF